MKNLIHRKEEILQEFLKKIEKNGMKKTFKEAIIKFINLNKVQFHERKTEMMKGETILVITHNASLTGAPKVALNIVKTLNTKMHYNVCTIFMAGGPLLSDFCQYSDVYNLNQLGYSDIEKKEKIDNLIKKIKKENKIKYAICNSIASIFSEICNSNDIENISLIHEMPNILKQLKCKKSLENAIKYSKKIIFPAEIVKRELEFFYKIPKEKIIIKPQGVELEKIDFSKQRAKKIIQDELGISAQNRIILGCGTGNFRKGVDFFIQIASKIKNKNVTFIWIGSFLDKELDIWMKHDLKKLNLEKKVIFLENRKEINYFFRGSDIFALVSREDPYPMVMINAIEANIPVIAFDDVGGASELLAQERGILVPYLNIEVFSKEIEKMLNEEMYREKIIKNAKEYLKENLNIEKYVNELVCILKKNN